LRPPISPGLVQLGNCVRPAAEVYLEPEEALARPG
jgi:hypothetical protein